MMRVIEFLIAVLIVVALFVLVGLFLPSSERVTHSIETNHPARQVYDTLAGFQRFRHWHPMRQHDPQVDIDISGPRIGEGARVDYRSKSSNVGNGSLEVVETVQDERIVLHQENDFYGTDKTHVLKLEPASSGKTLTITWTYEVDYGWNLLGRYAGLYVSRNVGEDMKRGLGNLAGLIATMPNFDYSDLNISAELVQPTNTVFVATTAERNISAVEEAMNLALRDIRRAIAANDLEEAGPFRLVTTNFGDTTYDFDIAIPVREQGTGTEATDAADADTDTDADANGANGNADAEANGDALDADPAADSWSATDEGPQEEHDACAEPLQPAPALGPLELPSNVSAGPGYAGCALVAEYLGHPAALPLVRDMLRSYAAAHGYDIHERAFEEYLSPAEDIAMGEGRFLVYWPVLHPNNPPVPVAVPEDAAADPAAEPAAEEPAADAPDAQ